MNKAELIEGMAEAANISKAAATRALDSFMESITEALKKGEQVPLIGFGTFLVRERAARTVRNPRSGEMIDVAATVVPVFKAGKGLKEAVADAELVKA